jgi:hypothetical protein
MFEKEAEEYTENPKSAWKQGMTCVGSVRQAFKDGAEFGFSKANEWHRQETNDIYDSIAEDWSTRYFVCIMKDKSRVTAIGSCDEGCNGEVSVNLFFEHNDDKYYLDDIVWWKEIELPKETK